MSTFDTEENPNRDPLLPLAWFPFSCGGVGERTWKVLGSNSCSGTSSMLGLRDDRERSWCDLIGDDGPVNREKNKVRYVYKHYENTDFAGR